MKLEILRAKIDRLDNRLLKLLNERTRLVAEVGRFKLANGQAVFAPERELNLLLRLTQRNRGPLSAEALHAIYREILSSSRASQEPLHIGCFAGAPERALAAARWRFGVSDRTSLFSSFAALRHGLKGRKIDAAVVDGRALLGLRPADSFLHVCERLRDSL